jgi:hypothetical protein
MVRGVTFDGFCDCAPNRRLGTTQPVDPGHPMHHRPLNPRSLCTKGDVDEDRVVMKFTATTRAPCEFCGCRIGERGDGVKKTGYSMHPAR